MCETSGHGVTRKGWWVVCVCGTSGHGVTKVEFGREGPNLRGLTIRYSGYTHSRRRPKVCRSTIFVSDEIRPVETDVDPFPPT